MDNWNRKKQDLTVKVDRVLKNAWEPRETTDGSRGIVLLSAQTMRLDPGAIEKVRTGVALTPPVGYTGLVVTEGNLGNYGVRISAGVELITPGEEAEVTLMNSGVYPYYIHSGDPIATVLFIRTPKTGIVMNS